MEISLVDWFSWILAKFSKKIASMCFFVIIMDRKLVGYLLLLPCDKMADGCSEGFVLTLTLGLSTACKVGTVYCVWLGIVYIVQTRKQKRWLGWVLSYYPQRPSIKWNIPASQAPPPKGCAPINSTTNSGGGNQTFKTLILVVGGGPD